MIEPRLLLAYALITLLIVVAVVVVRRLRHNSWQSRYDRSRREDRPAEFS